MKFDLAKFKKVASDKHSTTLQHPQGHTVKISHNSISPKMRGQLAALPMAEGGNVGASGFPVINVDKGKFDQDAAKLAGGNKPKPEMMAEGGTPSPVFTKTPSGKMVDQYGYDSEGKKYDPNVQETHINQANEGLGNEVKAKKIDPSRGVAGYAEGGDVEDSKAPVVINIGGQGGQQAPQIPDSMINKNPGAQAKAQAEQASGAGTPISQDPVTQANANPGALPFGVTPEMVAESAQQAPQKAQGAPQAPASALSLQTQPQLAPGANADGSGALAQQPPNAAPEAPDPFGTRASSESYQAGLGTQLEGMAGQSQAEGQQGKQEAQILGQAAGADQKALNIFQEQSQKAMKLSSDALDAYKNGEIEPHHFLSSPTVLGKIGNIIGLIGVGFGGPENGLKTLQTMIDQDVKVQMENRQAKQNVFTGYMHQLGNARDAADMTRIFNSNVYADKLKQAAASAQDPMSKARLLQTSGALFQQASDRLGMYSMRKSLESGVANGVIPPEHIIRAIVPKEQQDSATKQLKEAQDAIRLRDNTLSAFDQMAKINTVGNRLQSPIQTKKQIDAIKGVTLDKITKDVSGRVTPETVKLIGGAFDTMAANPETIAIQRKVIANLLSQDMNYPELKKWNIDPMGASRYNNAGESRIPTSAPVRR